ncbi:chemotaxis protein CheB [Candidatus Berkiella cookevillensis]|uniref:protein-glutamate methylesterase n=1 Tax=Candidatus Berkiella cookevillensis TaxID=437022 RepID=A0A0Q9YF68_9GAMM|nr:chemotaxis protein CheB [Candidatus Berkiella cookevillensis]MCS5708829.1 chemotaxis protein CheB [Candidatus Berkiella cookevillensis]
MSSKKYKAIVIGTSFGGFSVLNNIIPQFPKNFIPIIIVIHLKEDAKSIIAEYLNESSMMQVKEADLGETIQEGVVYIAPPGYHLLIEHDFTLSLSSEGAVNFSRPSIDVLFESAAVAYQSHLIGILLTGANSDGCKGLQSIQKRGGLTIVQDPQTAEAPEMPQAALNMLKIDHILSVDALVPFLRALDEAQSEELP